VISTLGVYKILGSRNRTLNTTYMSLISLSSSQNVKTYGYVIFLNFFCFKQIIFRKFRILEIK